MLPSTYETEAVIKLRQRALTLEADQDRLLAGASRARTGALRRVLACAGRWLIAAGTRLERRYGQASAPLASIQQGQT